MKLLIANRGEIAIRVLRAASELGIETVAVYSEDDARSLHVVRADEARPLRGVGPAAYLDAGQIVAVAAETGCDAVHPGYGFLAENAAFARRCAEAGITFVGPSPEVLELCGDKAQARALAERCGVPVLPGTSGPTTMEEAKQFLASLGDGASIMIKALAGGGGRGMRPVHDPDKLEAAFERCRSEARAAFGNGDLYVERVVPRARHLEVQVIGDGSGAVSHLWERECTLQRRHQKLVEVAPGPGLPEALRTQLLESALGMAREVRFSSLGTFEFLVDADRLEGMRTGEEPVFGFNEVNPRLQVEHTVTEEVTGVDLVRAQLRIAAGATLAELGLGQAEMPPPRGFAIELRVNMETMAPDGSVRPSGGTLTAFEPPSGPGVRVDSYGYAGYATNPRFDSLLAKLVCHSPSASFADAVSRTSRALAEFRIEGVRTNIPFLQNLLERSELVTHRLTTRFVDEHIAELAAPGAVRAPRFYETPPTSRPEPSRPGLAGAKVDADDPLAVLNHGKTAPAEEALPEEPTTIEQLPESMEGPAGTVAVTAAMQGTIVSIDVREGDLVRAGQRLLIMDAMKMEHVIAANTGGVVVQIGVSVGDAVYQGHPLVYIEETEVEAAAAADRTEADLDAIRADLAEVRERHAVGLDGARPDAVAKRRERGLRTARENVEDLCDPGSFVEYAPLVIAAQRRRRSEEDLIRNTPADGMVAGIGRINGDLFDDVAARCVVMSYDYTVLAGTQGTMNHLKKDRMFELARLWRLPLVLLAEGGGGRPGDTVEVGVSGFNVLAFNYFARLSGLVPLVGITAGRCFAGNAVLLGCCDVIIATEDSNIGVGGPAMVEGGGLGVFRPEEIGPMSVQVPNGVVDIPVADEAEAVQVAKRYLSYFQGPIKDWECADQRRLRGLVPENRLRIYDVRRIIETLADAGSVLELRRHWGHGMVTALARVEGRPIGVVANDPTHLAGAIDSPAADKGARFMQLCDAFDIPVLYLCDCPGIMVGPEIEKTALVRHAARMFVVGANVTVPFFTIVLRKAYGLGALAMVGGSSKAPMFTVSWPTGEYGGMGLEGAIKLGFRKELAAIEDPAERKKTYEEMVAAAYAMGRAVNAASHFEFDDVIDPADSRRWITSALRSVPEPPPRTGKKRPCVDAW